MKAPSARRASVACASLLVACGASTPLVPTGPHPVHVQEFVEVPYPPPPAQQEELPDGLADARCEWVDGYWDWQGRRWKWVPGRWVVPQPACYYAPPVVAWSKAAEPRLYFTPPRWYHDNATELEANQALCPSPTAC